MSYLVLARKYRPSTFSEVVGQEHVTRTLANAFAAGRVHHAFLFCGPRGCGKTTLARIVGKALNCRDVKPGTAHAHEPCGTCDACASIGNGSAVDYQEMDGASNRGIDAIRELTEAVRYQPAVLRKKVYVIDEVHMLTTEAFNALLKTLEEPPPHVTFVLATTEPHKLPNTILSRCQRYDFKLVPASRLGQHLASIFAREQLAVEPNAISLIVRESGGSVRDALSLCDQLISYVGDGAITEQHVADVLGVADRSLTRTLVRALASGDAGAALGAVESAINRGVDEIQLARAIVRYLRDLSVLQVAPNRRELIDATEEECAELASEAASLDRSRVTQMFDRMLRCCDELGKTLQPRLVLDCALIDVATVEPLVPLGDLIDRLGALEARLASGGARVTSRGEARAPASRAPASQAPASRAPASHASASNASASHAPATHASASNASASHAPASHASASNAPASRSGASQSASQSGASQSGASQSASQSGASQSGASQSGASHAASSGEAPNAPTSPRAVDGRAQRAEKPAFAVGTAPGSERAPVMAVPAPPPIKQMDRDADRQRSNEPRGGDRAGDRGNTGGNTGNDRRADKGHAPPKGDASGPVSMQPSGPVPQPEAVASGSGPKRTIPSSASEVLAAWSVALSEIERISITTHGAYEHARVLAWTPDAMELGYASPFEMFADLAEEKDKLDVLRRVLHEVFGHAPKIVVRTLAASEGATTSARSVFEAQRENRSAERSKREAEAREHPITKQVLQTFGGHIKEIKTDV